MNSKLKAVSCSRDKYPFGSSELCLSPGMHPVLPLPPLPVAVVSEVCPIALLGTFTALDCQGLANL